MYAVFRLQISVCVCLCASVAKKQKRISILLLYFSSHQIIVRIFLAVKDDDNTGVRIRKGQKFALFVYNLTNTVLSHGSAPSHYIHRISLENLVPHLKAKAFS